MDSGSGIRRRGLANRLSLGSTIPMVLVMAVMGALTLAVVRSNLDQLVERNARNTLTLVDELVHSEFTGTVRSYLRGRAESNHALMAYYHRRARQGHMSAEEARRTVEEILLDPDYGKVGTTGYLAGVTTEGILEIHPLSPGVDASGHEFMQDAMAMRDGYLEYEWQNPGETEPRLKAGYLSWFEPWDIMVWASSYKDEFAVLMDLTELRQRVMGITVDETGYVLLVDDEGILQAGSDREAVLSAIPSAPTGGLDETVVEVSRASESLRVETRREANLGWTIVVVTPLRLYEGMQRTLAIIIAVTVVLAGILIHLVVRLMVTRGLRPMRAIAATVDRVAAGDLTGTVNVNSRDEMQDVAELFNRVIGEFSAVLNRMHSVITVLVDAVQNLSTSTQEIASTSNEQAAAVKEVLSTMEDSDRLSRGVETRIGEVARIAANTRETVEQGFDLIKTSLAKMEEIRTTNTETITGIKTLGDRIESIWDIVNIINGIADQTKIIAFNAELEAAAAGDAGKNFQIVAGEIRRLADGTVDSTNEIRVKINEIQHASDKLIIASEQGTQRIREGWEVSTNIRGVFEDVLSSSEITANSAGEISRSTKMQVSSFEQIFQTLKQISESIDSFVESTAHTTDVADQLTEIADSFREQVEAFRVERTS
jgi:methyl-accepting chemotaxis protein